MALIIGGKEIECASKVIDWREHGMSLMPDSKNRPKKGTRLRDTKKTVIDLFVVHWTGSENGVKALFNTLNTRELGVEFFIDNKGVIFQFADPILVDTFDAGKVNPRSMGVEVSNYGFVGPQKPIPVKGKGREVYDTIIRGKAVKLAAYYPKQQMALEHLIEAVCRVVTTIPKAILIGNDEKVFRETLTDKQLSHYKGIIGHYQCSTKKLDCGPKPLQLMLDKGWLGVKPS